MCNVYLALSPVNGERSGANANLSLTNLCKYKWDIMRSLFLCLIQRASKCHKFHMSELQKITPVSHTCNRASSCPVMTIEWAESMLHWCRPSQATVRAVPTAPWKASPRLRIGRIITDWMEHYHLFFMLYEDDKPMLTPSCSSLYSQSHFGIDIWVCESESSRLVRCCGAESRAEPEILRLGFRGCYSAAPEM